MTEQESTPIPQEDDQIDSLQENKAKGEEKPQEVKQVKEDVLAEIKKRRTIPEEDIHLKEFEAFAAEFELDTIKETQTIQEIEEQLTSANKILQDINSKMLNVFEEKSC